VAIERRAQSGPTSIPLQPLQREDSMNKDQVKGRVEQAKGTV